MKTDMEYMIVKQGNKAYNLTIVEHDIKLTYISEAFVQCFNKDWRQKGTK